MLRENNVTVLGGDVEALVETNTVDAILEKYLYVQFICAKYIKSEIGFVKRIIRS